MYFPCFTFASFMMSLNKEPRFQGIGAEKCKQYMKSYPNGLSHKEVDHLFAHPRRSEIIGSEFYKRDSILFMMNIEEKGVVLKHVASNEYDVYRFCKTYFDFKQRVEEIGGNFVDERFRLSSE